jgi:hypothetical protein
MYFYMNVLVSCYDILEIIKIIVHSRKFHPIRKETIKNVFKKLCKFNL